MQKHISNLLIWIIWNKILLKLFSALLTTLRPYQLCFFLKNSHKLRAHDSMDQMQVLWGVVNPYDGTKCVCEHRGGLRGQQPAKMGTQTYRTSRRATGYDDNTWWKGDGCRSSHPMTSVVAPRTKGKPQTKSSSGPKALGQQQPSQSRLRQDNDYTGLASSFRDTTPQANIPQGWRGKGCSWYPASRVFLWASAGCIMDHCSEDPAMRHLQVVTASGRLGQSRPSTHTSHGPTLVFML